MFCNCLSFLPINIHVCKYTVLISCANSSRKGTRWFDQGILSVVSDIGFYPSVGKLNLVRDDKYPIRLTIQQSRK